ncbi:TIGR03750 family conjugal transfer protein [Pseudorhodoferax soli]|uniref:Conjugative transfer region protein (TIGR03750 family) n=1 Tax=Pseudorhodoferax soli TaxID=545864 RepID=A0A368XEB8_9BURK|nr:TIGR03750 family conjugal transfer protein [Pseudorhodoferax soli]RCW66205.1 conjugative transfer region protein (TIGR03750 family) [Pseudorhodoferax soli]
MSDRLLDDDGDGRVPLTDRVNSEPAILHGMTASEASWLGGLSLFLYTLGTGMVIYASGLWQLLLAPLIATIGTLWFGSMWLQKIKRDRPDGYYGHALQLWLSRHGLSHARFIRHAGYWSIGRTDTLSLRASLTPGSEPSPAPSPAPAAPGPLPALARTALLANELEQGA